MTLKRMAFAVTASIGFLLAIASIASAQEFTFPVEHNHKFKSCKGDLMINGEGVEYRTTHKNHSRKWTYIDIKMITLVSPRRVNVLTYESRPLTLGRDEAFQFKVLKGELSKDVNDFLLARVSRPLATSFVKSEENPQYAIPVRHRQSFGSDQGTLKVYADTVAYESVSTKSSRRWRWTDIQSISRMGPYQFSVTTYEPKFGGPTKTYNFDLKERMEDSVYDLLWSRIYKPTLPASPEVKEQLR
jgi:hypothetical protein